MTSRRIESAAGTRVAVGPPLSPSAPSANEANGCTPVPKPHDSSVATLATASAAALLHSVPPDALLPTTTPVASKLVNAMLAPGPALSLFVIVSCTSSTAALCGGKPNPPHCCSPSLIAPPDVRAPGRACVAVDPVRTVGSVTALTAGAACAARPGPVAVEGRIRNATRRVVTQVLEEDRASPGTRASVAAATAVAARRAVRAISAGAAGPAIARSVAREERVADHGGAEREEPTADATVAAASTVAAGRLTGRRHPDAADAAVARPVAGERRRVDVDTTDARGDGPSDATGAPGRRRCQLREAVTEQALAAVARHVVDEGAVAHRQIAAEERRLGAEERIDLDRAAVAAVAAVDVPDHTVAAVPGSVVAEGHVVDQEVRAEDGNGTTAVVVAWCDPTGDHEVAQGHRGDVAHHSSAFELDGACVRLERTVDLDGCGRSRGRLDRQVVVRKDVEVASLVVVVVARAEVTALAAGEEVRATALQLDGLIARARVRGIDC